MKGLSITKKITLWYTLFLLLIVACFFILIISVGERQTVESSKEELIEEVIEAHGEIVREDGVIQFRDGFQAYDDGVYLGMYDLDGALIEGKIPVMAYNQPDFDENHISELIDDKGSTWYLYDIQFKVDDESVWVRGYREEVVIEKSYAKMIKLGLFFLPFLLFLAAIGGYIITRRSFAPVRKIIECVEGVEKDADFSRRIDVSTEIAESNNEIVELSSKFNTMFDTIQSYFDKEKQFTSDVSHELRTPLSLIVAQSDYALTDESYREEALQKIKGEAKRMAELISKLLLLSRSDLGKVELQCEPINLSELCMMIAEQQSMLLSDEKQIDLITDIEDDVFVLGDEATLIRIILNLTENAAKYGENIHGEKSIIKVSVKKNDGKAICCVEDNGQGISPEDLEKIWDRFYRIDKSRTKEGNGLGLSMVKALVTANHANIDVESKVGEGCRFYITFDLYESEGLD